MEKEFELEIEGEPTIPLGERERRRSVIVN